MVPELSIITLFILMGYNSNNIRLDPLSDISMLFALVIGCFFIGAQLLQSFLFIPKQDIRFPNKILALISMTLILIPPFVSYGQGWNTFVATCIMFCFVVIFGIPKSFILKKIKMLIGLDILLRALTWGCLAICLGALYSGVEPETRSWLLVLLGFYIYASIYLMIEMQSSKSLEEKSNLIMYLGESRSLELVAILQLFGVIGLTTLFLSEYDSLNSLNLTFYAMFSLVAIVGVFRLLVWSKDPSMKKKFNYYFFLVSNNIYLLCWVVAEWFFI